MSYYLLDIFISVVRRTGAELSRPNCSFWIRNELEHTYEVLTGVFKLLHSSDLVEFTQPKMPPTHYVPTERSLNLLREEVLEAITRVKTVEEVMLNDTTPQLKESFQKLMDMHMDSMEKINMDPDMFFQVREVFDFGLKCYHQLMGEDELWYGVAPEGSLPAELKIDFAE